MAREDWAYGLYKTDDDGNFVQVVGGIGPLEIAKDGTEFRNLVTGDTYDLTSIGSGGSSTDTRIDIADSSGVIVSDAEQGTFTAGGDASVNVTNPTSGEGKVEYTVNLPSVSDDGTVVLDSPSDWNFGSGLTASDDGDGTATVSADRNSHVQELVDSPNGHIMSALLEDTEAAEISVPVPDGETLKVYRWGGYKIADGTAPTGLQVQLLDASDTVQSSANTVNSESTDPATPVSSYGNSSGSTSIFKLRVNNGTGNAYTTDGVGGIFGYLVE